MCQKLSTRIFLLAFALLFSLVSSQVLHLEPAHFGEETRPPASGGKLHRVTSISAYFDPLGDTK